MVFEELGAVFVVRVYFRALQLRGDRGQVLHGHFADAPIYLAVIDGLDARVAHNLANDAAVTASDNGNSCWVRVGAEGQVRDHLLRWRGRMAGRDYQPVIAHGGARGACQEAVLLRTAHLVPTLISLCQLDHTVQRQHAAPALGLEDLDVLVLGALVVKRGRDLRIQRRR